MYGTSVMRQKQKILIVDDEAPFRTAMRRLLEKTYSVVEAETGSAALQLAQSE